MSRRFLRARRFDVNGALGQFQATEDWRRDNEINKLYENFDVDSYEEARKVVSYYRCVFLLGPAEADIYMWHWVNSIRNGPDDEIAEAYRSMSTPSRI